MISILDMWTVQVQGDLTLPYLPVRSIKGMWIAGQTGAAPAFFSGWIDQPRYPVCVTLEKNAEACGGSLRLGSIPVFPGIEVSL